MLLWLLSLTVQQVHSIDQTCDYAIEVNATMHVLSEDGDNVSFFLWDNCQTTEDYEGVHWTNSVANVYAQVCSLCPGHYVLKCENVDSSKGWNEGWIEIDGVKYCEDQGNSFGDNEADIGFVELDLCNGDYDPYCPQWSETATANGATIVQINADGIGSDTVVPQECEQPKVDVTVTVKMLDEWGDDVSFELWDSCKTTEEYDGVGSNYEGAAVDIVHNCNLCPGTYALKCENLGGFGWNGGWLEVDGVEYCKDQGSSCGPNRGQLAYHDIDIGCTGSDCEIWSLTPDCYHDGNSASVYAECEDGSVVTFSGGEVCKPDSEGDDGKNEDNYGQNEDNDGQNEGDDGQNEGGDVQNEGEDDSGVSAVSLSAVLLSAVVLLL
jgi:hypothetical protein